MDLMWRDRRVSQEKGGSGERAVGVGRAVASLLACLAADLSTLAFAQAPTPPMQHPASTKEWTVLIYMNGKNDLEPFAMSDFKELAAVGSSADVNFVVELGRPARRPGSQAAMAHRFGGWSGARRFYVTSGLTPAPGNQLETVGSAKQVDMGSPETLATFLQWGKLHYPARRYLVVVWNHGQGYRLRFSDKARARATPARPLTGEQRDVSTSHRAISLDADSNSVIYNADLRKSLSKAFGPELRLVGFDACLMAMVETAYELKDVAPVMVGSEELEPGDGWDYTRFATALVAAPRSDEGAVARMIVKSYGDTYGPNGDGTTMSAIDLTAMDGLARELSGLSDMLLANRQRTFPEVSVARARREAYNTARDPVSIDLIGFLGSLAEAVRADDPNSSLLPQIEKTRAAAAAAILAPSYASRDRGEPYGSNGLAIYFPLSRQVFDTDAWNDGYLRSNTDKPLAFVRNERWSAFLAAYLGLPG